jgi:hypothetical protein
MLNAEAVDSNEAAKAMSKFVQAPGTRMSHPAIPVATASDAMFQHVADLEIESQEMKVAYQHLRARIVGIEKLSQADVNASISAPSSSGWFAALIASLGLAGTMGVVAVKKQRAGPIVAMAGKYDGQIFDMAAKKDLWNNWDPNAPRSEDNFNPFERNTDGNGPDCSGYFPGEGKYKDPARPDVDFATMMAEKTEMAEIEANPKAGDVPGAPGRVKGN